MSGVKLGLLQCYHDLRAVSFGRHFRGKLVLCYNRQTSKISLSLFLLQRSAILPVADPPLALG